MDILLSIIKNIGIVVLTIIILIAGAFLCLKVLDVLLRIKSRGREADGLSKMWVTLQQTERANQDREPQKEID